MDSSFSEEHHKMILKTKRYSQFIDRGEEEYGKFRQETVTKSTIHLLLYRK
jgi:hypothetical protein